MTSGPRTLKEERERRGGWARSEVCRNFAWREHNFNYRSWPHCLGSVVGARARAARNRALSAKFSARVPGTKALARSQPRKEDQRRGEGISSLLSCSPLRLPHSFTVRTDARSGDGGVGCLPIKRIFTIIYSFDTSWKRNSFESEKRREFQERFLSLWGIWRKRGQKDRYR